MVLNENHAPLVRDHYITYLMKLCNAVPLQKFCNKVLLVEPITERELHVKTIPYFGSIFTCQRLQFCHFRNNQFCFERQLRETRKHQIKLRGMVWYLMVLVKTITYVLVFNFPMTTSMISQRKVFIRPARAACSSRPVPPSHRLGISAFFYFFI